MARVPAVDKLQAFCKQEEIAIMVNDPVISKVEGGGLIMSRGTISVYYTKPEDEQVREEKTDEAGE